MKLTVIGSGNMGGAMIKGFAKSGRVENITITAKSEATLERFRQEFPQLKTTLNNAEAAKDADVIILAVKPWLIENVINEIRDNIDITRQTVISVAANIYTDKLIEMLSGNEKDQENIEKRVFYAMPNIAAEFGESMTFVSSAKGVSKETIDGVEELLSLLGSVKVVEERLMAPGMMMAGCGIAYVMRYLRAMMEGGVEMGFYPKDSQQIAMQTMKGAITLLEQTGLHPEAAIDKVTTPGGITIKGLNELDHSAFNSAVIRSLKAGLK